jgi:hypothetical protein
MKILWLCLRKRWGERENIFGEGWLVVGRLRRMVLGAGRGEWVRLQLGRQTVTLSNERERNKDKVKVGSKKLVRSAEKSRRRERKSQSRLKLLSIRP